MWDENSRMLEKILLEKEVVSQKSLEQALRSKNGYNEQLYQTLVRLGITTEDRICRTISEQMGIPYIDLSNTNITRELLDKVPLKTVFDKKLIPILKENGTITVAVSDPFDLNTIDELRLVLKVDIKQVIAKPTEIEVKIRELFGVGADELEKLASHDDFKMLSTEPERQKDIEMAEDTSLVKFVNQLLIQAAKDGASDIHIEPFEDKLKIRYRIDGILHRVPVPSQIYTFRDAIVSRIKIMANLNIAEKRLSQDGAIQLKIGGKEIDVRVSIISGIFGEGVVLRLLNRDIMFMELEALGMPPEVYSRYKELIEEPYGILLVTGPTGSGKTTTLYASLHKINSEEDKIITIEDPVEYKLSGVKQIQVNPKIGIDFAKGLRSILRHDPDIIMVGEIRDLETAQISIQSALTGHFVFSTLHTNDAPSALTRLIDMGVEPYLVASTIEGVMAQRLLRTICGHCKREQRRDDKYGSRIPEDITSYTIGTGCEKCRFTGYKGRIGAFELMSMTDELREMVLRKDSSARLKKYVINKNMKTLRETGWDKVRHGITTPDEVLRMTKDDRF